MENIKKIKSLLIIVIISFVVLLCGCSGGNSDQKFKIDYNNKETYTQNLSSSYFEYDVNVLVEIDNIAVSLDNAKEFATIKVNAILHINKYVADLPTGITMHFELYKKGSSEPIDEAFIMVLDNEVRTSKKIVESFTFWDVPNVDEVYTIKIVKK